MAERLEKTTIEAKLAEMGGWQLRAEKLYKSFTFGNFVEAFGFLTQVALESEKLGHHPEIYNVYRTVELELTTHDAGGISERDFALAERIESLLSQPSPT
ncbi:MAG: 4a-hydroxytetrahydrobiopterin dehydratase [Trueperaceae bacterium]|nr:MAG: 4a-hydroxytetrahydrobiopterin dehydratase [Trueperaceae bacterium]